MNTLTEQYLYHLHRLDSLPDEDCVEGDVIRAVLDTLWAQMGKDEKHALLTRPTCTMEVT